MGLERKKRAKNAQPVKSEFSGSTAALGASNTTEIINLSMVAEKVSFQASGDLAGTVEFSLDGENWKNSTPIGASNAIVTFTTHAVAAIKVTRTSGSGKLRIGAR